MDNIYKTAFENSYDGICVFDDNGKGIIMNEAAERITGFSRKDFIGETVMKALESGIISNSITEVVYRTKSTYTDVVSIRGTEVLATGNPILSKNGNISHVVLNVRDISELNNLRLDVILSIALSRKQKRYNIPLIPLNRSFESEDDLVLASPAMQQVARLALQVAEVDSTVMILGESGVGKEVVAKLIHSNSKRKDKSMVNINCGAIPKDLLESELFGYESGAFTGANSMGKKGLFEVANGGTVFLDEIAEMPGELQVKLLRVLQERKIRRLGGTVDIPIDVRIISATNKNLEQYVREGKFREDLYYRLNIVPIKIPPLRERPEDIQQLAHLYLNKMNKKYGLEKYFQPGLVELLHQYNWPGNTREMQNMIERLVVTSEENEISWNSLPFLSSQSSLRESYSLKSTLERIEKNIIIEKLQMFKTTRKVAQALGISQPSVVKKMKKYGIKIDDL